MLSLPELSLSMNLAEGKTTRDKAENTVVHVVSTGHCICSEDGYESGALNFLLFTAMIFQNLNL